MKCRGVCSTEICLFLMNAPSLTDCYKQGRANVCQAHVKSPYVVFSTPELKVYSVMGLPLSSTTTCAHRSK